MANNNFRSLEEFIDGFTRNDPYEAGLYEYVFWGLEFEFRGKLYRLTKEDHFGKYGLTPDIFVGIYDYISGLLESKDIEGVPFKGLIVSEETRVTSMD